MFYQVVFVLAVTSCCTNAAFTVNVYDNGVDVLDATNDLESCNYQECDQLCRRLGFPGGACVGDRCKCDNFKQATVLEDGELQRSDAVRSCDSSGCDQLCRHLGLPGGSCINGRCIRNNKQSLAIDEVSITDHDDEKPNLNAELAEPDNALRSASSKASCDCDPRSCDVYCFRIRYTGGICVTGQCRCYK